jgi:hypothetical protein
VALVGHGAGALKGNQHVKCALDTPMMNLGVTLLNKVGVPIQQMASSNGTVSDL